ncbi:MAG TPA: glycosyltransferase [Feifaniaceae bacterium]|nr:glycosyltransferase [Feifaniaceae bacterium]
MSQVIFYTQAYQAEKTIGRALESLLRQTSGDWVCYCIDNGCTDQTGEIIARYARLDRRIKMHRVERNDPSYFFTFLPTILERHPEEDFFTTLDADDEYTPDFLEKMLPFIRRNRLEIAACGNELIHRETGTSTTGYMLPGGRDWILKKEEYGRCFPQYCQFMYTIWGKLYAVSVLKKIDWASMGAYMYGVDTLICTECFRRASRIGILAQSLHKYYLSSKTSVSFQWDHLRIASTRILYEAMRGFLESKCGFVSAPNGEFLLHFYMGSVRRTLNVLLNARISPVTKLAGVLDIFTHRYTEQLIAKEQFGIGFDTVEAWSSERRELCAAVADWLLSLDEVPGGLVEDYCGVGEVLSAAAENAGAWLFFKKLRVRFFLEQGRHDAAADGLLALMELIPDDPEVLELQTIILNTENRRKS